MFPQLLANALTFVWQPEHLSGSFIKRGKSTNSGSIVDLSFHQDPENFLNSCALEGIELKLSQAQFNNPNILKTLQNNRPESLWVECIPPSQDVQQETLFADLSVPIGCPVYLVTSSIPLMQSYFEKRIESFNLALKGNEAVGHSGAETTLTLISYLESLATKFHHFPAISVWGGCCTPEAAAALLISGIQRIIFEHLHILTDEYSKDFSSELKKRLSTFQLSHTQLLNVSPSNCLRVYDKGNSHAVKDLAGMLKGMHADNTIHKRVGDHVRSRLIPVTTSSLGNDQLIAVGVETAFAQIFIRRYGTSAPQAITTFAAQTIRHIQRFNENGCHHNMFDKTAEKLGCKYPLVQGAMACISDNPHFALAIAEAGGLPTFALGIKSVATLEQELGKLKETMGDLAYGINVITLPENPYKDEQLEWIKKTKPPFVVISAGSPLFAKELQGEGLNVIYVTSDTDLMKLALDTGIRFIVCEGHEAGGHVGNHSTLTLAQSALELRRGDDKLAQTPLILAGGIFDSSSANRAFLLGADALQVGTAYLATEEIVKLKAVHELYQDMVLRAGFGDTTITGQSIGLKVRSLASPKTMQIQQLEAEYQNQNRDENSIRSELEKVSVGSLTIAAKGTLPGSTKILSSEDCSKKGQYMCGAVSGGIDTAMSVSKLHMRLTNPQAEMVLRNGRNILLQKTVTPSAKPRIAITGMAISNSLGNSPEDVWKASYNLKSGISQVPQARWDHSEFFSKKLNTPGKTYCSVGAFTSLDISRKELGISPHDFRTMTHSTKLTLWLAHRAITSSGILESNISKDRIGVIVAQNSGESAHTIEDLTITVKAKEIIDSLLETLQLDPALAQSLIGTLTKNRISTDDTTLLGRLSCTAGGFVCNKYNFQGISFAVTAACATGLVALYNAVQLLRNNILDVAIVGGGEELLHPASYLEFSALGALGGKNSEIAAQQTSRPFDSHRDGMILGEGGAMLVLERESSAKRRGANIAAFITGVGASNNDLGMVESVAATQQLAIDASLKDAHYSSAEVDLVECHATATPTGDIEEVKALKEIFPKGSNTVLASFKSQIGHTLGTSGLNSLIRGVLAMEQRVFPPTLNYDNIDPDIDLESWGFRVFGKPQVWPHNGTRPRRFQVNAFGFGGANYVVQLEQADWSADADDSPEVAEIEFPGRADEQALPGLEFYSAEFNDMRFRLGISQKIERDSLAKNLVEYLVKAQPNAADKRVLNKSGIFVEPAGSEAELALLFAGQGTHYKQMGKEMYNTFPTIRKWMDTISELADFDILEIMFRDEDTDLRKTVWQQPALFVLEYSIYKQLEEYRLQPSILAGHSMGELTALAVAGVFGYEDAFRIISKRATCMDKASKMVKDPGAMIAVDAPHDVLDTYINSNQELFYTNYNSPHQTVIGGSTEAVNNLAIDLEKQKYWNHQLSVSMAFHSPIMRVIRDELGDYLADIDFKPPKIPVISNTTRRPYPEDIGEIQKIIISHLESPVQWLSNMKTILDEFKVNCFLEIGPRDTLCRFLSDISPESLSLYTCYPESEVQTFKDSIAHLYSLGQIEAPVQPEHLNLKDQTIKNQRDSVEIGRIIQNEINIYALQGVERYLKPAIIKTIQQKIDPTFSAADLNQHLGGDLPVAAAFPSVQAATPAGEPETPDKSPAPVPNSESTVETLISIIMDATGYERAEIEPHMDIRQDLSIRSSRLPIIMHAVEEAFSITIKIEEFMGIKTIADFAQQIDTAMADQGIDKADRQHLESLPQTATTEGQKPSRPRLPVKRLVSRKIELPPASPSLLELGPEDHILILSMCNDEIVGETRQCLEEKFGSRTSAIQISSLPQGNKLNACDLQAVARKLDTLAEQDTLTGLLIITGDEDMHCLPAVDQLSSLLSGLFLFVQRVIESDKRKFCLHLRLEETETGPINLLAEGLLGVFLAAQIEYQSMIFRSLLCRDLPDLNEIIDICLDNSQPIIELELEGGTLHSQDYFHQEAPVTHAKRFVFSQDDVILISAGARGITAHLAKALSKFGSTLLLLGRTPYQEGIDYHSDDETLLYSLYPSWSELSKEAQEKKLQELKIAKEINKLTRELSQHGSKVKYFQCDITDKLQVNNTISTCLDQFEKIDTIIHGAGIISDGFISLLTPKDFQKVMDAKLTGLDHLVKAVGEQNLRCIIGLSSIAALTGNIGQANYCCANRAMAAYIRGLQTDTQLSTKVFWLPPIEGAGMADDPEVKDLIKLKVGDNAFVDTLEIAELMIMELTWASLAHCWVAPIRQLPAIDSISIENVNNIKNDGWFDCAKYPMLDSIIHLDFKAGRLVAERLLTQEHDLWINDHKPFKWLDHPIASAIMIVESFFEIVQLYHPHLFTKTIKNVSFNRILECPPQGGTATRIECQTHSDDKDQLISHVSLARQSGMRDQKTTLESYFSGETVSTYSLPKSDTSPRLSLPAAQKPALNQERILQYYEQRTGLTGRYRVLDEITEIAKTTVTGVMVYPQVDDFSTPQSQDFLYPHYLLEALMQLAGFHSGLQTPEEQRVKVPVAIGQLDVWGEVNSGEKIYLSAELRDESKEDSVWDCQAIGENGTKLLTISALTMKWFN